VIIYIWKGEFAIWTPRGRKKRVWEAGWRTEGTYKGFRWNENLFGVSEFSTQGFLILK